MKKKINITKLTTPRQTVITKKFLRDYKQKKRDIAQIYAGKTNYLYHVWLRRDMRGHHVGEFAVTKKLGKLIHNSARNTKRKNKKQK